MKDFMKAAFFVWAIASCVLGVLLLLLFSCSDDFIRSFSSFLRMPHQSCVLCGMTGDFIKISHINFSSFSNVLSLPVFVFCVSDVLVFIPFVFVRIGKTFLGRMMKDFL